MKQKDWYLNHRMYVTEAVCKHSVGHHKGIHGCDGCCENVPEDIWSKVTEDKEHHGVSVPETWETKLELGGEFIDYEGDLRPKSREKLKDFFRQELTHAREEGFERAVSIVENYPKMVLELHGGKLPWIIFQGKADEDEKKQIYEMAFRDILQALHK